MLTWFIVLLIVAIVAALFAYTDLAMFAAGIARTLVFVFLALFVVLHLLGGRRPQHTRPE